MPLDGPNFLRNIGETEEERDILSPLTDDIKTVSNEAADPASAGDAEPESGKETETTDGDGKNPDGTADAGAEDPNKKPEDTTPSGDTTTPSDKETTTTQKIKYGEREFNSIEEFTEYTRQLEQSIAKTEKNEVPANDEAKKRLEALKSVPVVKAKLPLSEHYQITNEDGSKTFNMDAYMNDVTESLVLSIQQALVQGPLAAVQFGMLRQALLSEMNSASESARIDKESADMTNKLYAEFPVLKTNEKIKDMVTRAIDGETVQRERIAQAKNEKPSRLTYEDIHGIITDILSVVQTQSTQTVDPAEKLKSSPSMSGRETAKKTNPVEDDIDAMLQHKKNAEPGPGNFSF